MMKPGVAAALVAAAAVLFPARARAADDAAAICTDRPAKGTAACTVPPGRWQVEMDAADWSHRRVEGGYEDQTQFANTTFKYGVGERLDLELNLAPLVAQQTPGAGRTDGFGDLALRAKLGLTQGDRAVSLLPFVTLPTASAGLGHGGVEGGVIAPVSLALPEGFSLTLDPEVDVLKDEAGQGRHAAYVMAVALEHALTPAVAATAELWASDEQDPHGRRRQASVDLGLAWIPPRDQRLQLDGGVNLGLSHDTPGVQLYLGVSRRF